MICLSMTKHGKLTVMHEYSWLAENEARSLNFWPYDWLNGAMLWAGNLVPTNTVNEFVNKVIKNLESEPWSNGGKKIRLDESLPLNK